VNDAAKERWSKSDQEEAVENLARMASITERLCFATFGELAARDSECEDALFAIRHLATMITTFQRDYIVAIHRESHCDAHSLLAPLDRTETEGGSVVAITRVTKCDSLA
jgi:hypothetical protein